MKRTPANDVVATLRRTSVGDADARLQRHSAAGSGASGAVGSAGGDVPAETAGRIRPSGDRFDPKTRERMEHAFGADFTDVRVHTSATIDTAAEGLSADAFTLGRDVYVRRALYRPSTAAGDRLLAHELAHTLQQGGSRIRRSTAPPIDVSTDMPADRVSTKKQLLHLDFVKMKRYDPKYGKAIKKVLGMKAAPRARAGRTGTGGRRPASAIQTPAPSTLAAPTGGGPRTASAASARRSEASTASSTRTAADTTRTKARRGSRVSPSSTRR